MRIKDTSDRSGVPIDIVRRDGKWRLRFDDLVACGIVLVPGAGDVPERGIASRGHGAHGR